MVYTKRIFWRITPSCRRRNHHLRDVLSRSNVQCRNEIRKRIMDDSSTATNRTPNAAGARKRKTKEPPSRRDGSLV